MSAPPQDRGRWDRDALRAGASVSALFAVPPTVIARVLVDRDDTSGWAPLLTVLALGGFVLGAGVATWHQDRGTPLSHGLMASAGVFVVAQAAFLVIRVATGGDVRPARILFSFSLAALAGLLGAFLGSLLQRGGARPAHRTDTRTDP